METGWGRAAALGIAATLLGVAVESSAVRAADPPSSTSSPASAPGGAAGANETSVRPARASGESQSVTGTVRTGIEYDSNAYRTPVDRAVGGMVGRYFASLEGELPAPEESSLNFDLRHGGKWFPRRPGADALLTQIHLGYRRPIGDRFWGVVDVGMKDRLERRRGVETVPHQDYNRGGVDAGVGARFGPVAGMVSGGWRYFAFRPNPASSNHGPQGTASVSVEITPRIRSTARYTYSFRNFESVRLVRTETQGGNTRVRSARSGETRNDHLHVGRLSFGYRGPFIAELEYQFLRNVSNSYGQEITRHGLELRATVPLPLRLYVSGEFQIRRTNYRDPVFLSADLQVDENNRNAAVISLARVFGDHWELEARYRMFVEEFGAATDYRRQTGSLEVGYVF